MFDTGQELTKREVSGFPRGPRGSGQNIFRAILWLLFRNYYSAKWTMEFPTRESIFVDAIRTTREYHPTFWPEPA